VNKVNGVHGIKRIENHWSSHFVLWEAVSHTKYCC